MREHRWGGDDGPADRLNRERADLIRVLRDRLGPGFVGGLAFDREPPDEFADVVSDLPTDREAYLDLVQGAVVVVAGLGFGGSPSWKLAEHLERGVRRPVRQVARRCRAAATADPWGPTFL